MNLHENIYVHVAHVRPEYPHHIRKEVTHRRLQTIKETVKSCLRTALQLAYEPSRIKKVK